MIFEMCRESEVPWVEFSIEGVCEEVSQVRRLLSTEERLGACVRGRIAFWQKKFMEHNITCCFWSTRLCKSPLRKHSSTQRPLLLQWKIVNKPIANISLTFSKESDPAPIQVVIGRSNAANPKGAQVLQREVVCAGCFVRWKESFNSAWV